MQRHKKIWLNTKKEGNRRKLTGKKAVFSAVCILLLNGCAGKNSDLLLQEAVQTEVSGDVAVVEQADGTEAGSSGSEDVVSAGDADDGQMYIYVCGCVQAPGVYICETGARMYEAVEAAGGLTEEAQQAALNLAEVLCDGQMVYVPSISEQAETGIEAGAPAAASGLVNINTATKEELMTLTGIGEAKADSIISYREKEGVFTSIEEIMNIDGIKDGVFSKIKDDITV